MISLRDSSSVYSSLGTDDEPTSFGWWIGTETHSQGTTEEDSGAIVSTKTDSTSQHCRSLTSEFSQDSGTASDNFSRDAIKTTNDNDERVVTANDEEIELQFLRSSDNDDDDDKSIYGRRIDGTTCYTPDRLIRCGEFRVVAPSPPGLWPILAELVDTAEERLDCDSGGENVGAAKLVGLLQSHQETNNVTSSSSSKCKLCSCTLRYGNDEILHNTENCTNDAIRRTDNDGVREFNAPTLNRRDKKIPPTIDQVENIINHTADDSSGISSSIDVNDNQGDDWSCCNDDLTTTRQSNDSIERRASNEFSYVSLGYGSAECDDKQSNDQTIATSTPASAATLEIDDQNIHHRRSLATDTPDPEFLARLALAVEPEQLLLPAINLIATTDAELEIERLRSRVERLQDNSKILCEEVTLLKRDYAIDECRVNHLSEDVSKLQTEVHELRYLDDLLKLLSGELERVSDQIWPFNARHAKSGIEEINLIV